MAGCLVRGKEYEGSLGFNFFMGVTSQRWFDHIVRFSIEYHRGTGKRPGGEPG